MKTLRQKDMQGSMGASSKWLTLLVSVALMASLSLMLVACGGGAEEPEATPTETETSGSANIPNPIEEVKDLDVINERLGVNMYVPKEATVESCSIIDNALGEVVFTYEGTTYTYRAQASSKISDISGLNYDFEKKATFDTANASCSMEYNEDGPGFCHWFDDIALVTYSVSVDEGATEAGLTEISTVLVAEQILM